MTGTLSETIVRNLPLAAGFCAANSPAVNSQSIISATARQLQCRIFMVTLPGKKSAFNT